MIELDQLTRRFASVTAVDRLSLSARPGDILGFLGPNGAGKSTSMKMATGYLRPTAGTARIDGVDVWRRPVAAKRRFGYLPEGAPAYPEMPAEAFLGFVAEIRGLRGRRRRAAVDRAIARADLGSVLGRPIDTLSKGFKRRVGLAAALLHDPPVLILDEPTDGLDPNQKHAVRTLLRALSPGRTILVSTHLLEEVEALCTRVAIIARGRLVVESTPAALLAQSPDGRLDSLFRTLTAPATPA